VRAEFALERDEIRPAAQRTVRIHPQHDDAAGAVVGDDQERAGGVESQVDGVVAAARLPVDQRQFARRLVDGEGRDLVGSEWTA